MKKLLSTLEVAELINESVDGVKGLVRNGFVDKNLSKTLGVEIGSTTRSTGFYNLGGDECTDFSTLPINITVRWTSNTQQCNEVANKVFNYLLELSHVMFKGRKFEMARLLDNSPIPLGKDNNIYEMMIRVNITYLLDKED